MCLQWNPACLHLAPPPPPKQGTNTPSLHPRRLFFPPAPPCTHPLISRPTLPLEKLFACRLMPEGMASSKSGMPGAPTAVAVPEVTTSESFQQHCTNLTGLCIVAAFNPSADDFGTHKATLQVSSGCWTCCAVLCCAVLCCAVLCCAVLCCAVLCCAVL